MNDDQQDRTWNDTSPVQVAPLASPSAAALCAFATSLGFACVRIDLAGCEDKATLLARVAAALEFPGYFGGNWDAFFDCLADLSWKPAAGYLLILQNAATLQAVAPEAFDTAIAILGDVAAAWRARGVPFRAYVDLP
jgi:hypothetical protein